MEAASETSGYSGTPLARKLGLKAGWRLAVLDGPDDVEALLGDGAPAGLRIVRRLAPPLDAVWLFATERRVLERRLPAVLERLPADGTLWLSWPKKASDVATDITEDVLREVVLPTGWVDTKVAAVDATWSGLRFALRRELRPTGRAS
jgi:hypothetical protein